MKYICYVLSLAALAASGWNILHLQNDYALIMCGCAIFSLQLAIFWKKDRSYSLRRLEFRRRPIVVNVPQVVMPDKERESV